MGLETGISRAISNSKATLNVQDEVLDLNERVLSRDARKKLIEEAGISSVLVCLQTPVKVKQIIAHKALASGEAIKRLSAFHLIL